MRNHIVRPHREPEDSKSGLGGYADMITDLSRTAGYDTDETEIEISLQDGIFGFMINDVLKAIIRTMRMKKEDLCHFVFEGSALYILLCRSKKIVTFHHYVYRSENNSRKWYVLWKLAAMMAVKRADRIIAISEQTKQEIIKELNANPSRITVISHMANDTLHPDENIVKKRWIGCMGTLTERKNYPALLRIFARVSEDPAMSGYELHICGKGPMKDALLEQAAALGIEKKLFFHQNLNNDQINEFYNSCRLTINTSMHEGLGMLTLESQACGTPVLYFRNADIPSNTTAAAISCDGEEDAAEKALKYLKDEKLYRQAVDCGLDYTRRYCENYRTQTLDVYESLLHSEDRINP